MDCASVGGVELPTFVDGDQAGLAGALPPSLGELCCNAITAVPTEIRALTGLTYLALNNNAITSVPAEIAALTGLDDGINWVMVTMR